MNYRKKITWAAKVRKAAAVGTKVLDAAWEVVKDPKPTNIARNLSELAKDGLEAYEKSFDEQVIRNTWCKIDGIPDAYTEYVMGLFGTPTKLGDCHMFEVGDVPCALCEDDRLYVPTKEDLPGAVAVIGKKILDSVGTRFTIVKTRQNSWEEICTLAKVPPQEILEAPETSRIYERVKKFLDKGVHRSLFVHGPPGTGKSCLAINMAEKVGGYQMIMAADDFVEDHDSLAIMKFLKPSVLIINDINYVEKVPASTLTLLEDVAKVVPLVIVTANTNKLDAAVMRPGRFDEVIEFKHLGALAVENIIGKSIASARHHVVVPEEVVNDLLTWPAAFLKELRERVDVLGAEHFVKEYEDLKSRVTRNVETDGGSILK